MMQLHDQCLAEKCELEKEMKYLQVDQQDMRSSVYKLQQRMSFLRSAPRKPNGLSASSTPSSSDGRPGGYSRKGFSLGSDLPAPTGLRS